jgi:hypothetical protein
VAATQVVALVVNPGKIQHITQHQDLIPQVLEQVADWVEEMAQLALIQTAAPQAAAAAEEDTAAAQEELEALVAKLF